MLKRLFATAAVMTFVGGAAFAQTPAAPVAPPAAAPAPAAAPSGPPVVAAGDLVATAKASGQFTILLKALDAANLTAVLQRNPNLTLFAPTDAAFNALPAGTLDMLMQTDNAPVLQKLLTYHVINAPVDSSKIKGAKGGVKTVEGAEVQLDGSGDALLVDGATITQADVRATNGTLHVIDKVLIPSDVPQLASAATSMAATGTAAPTSAVAPTGASQSTPPVNTPAPGAAAQ